MRNDLASLRARDHLTITHSVVNERLVRCGVILTKVFMDDREPLPDTVLGRSVNLPRIDRYLLLQKLGEGGMGVVYAAYDEELERKVAVKVLHPSRQDDSQLRTRILREAQALARVSAPNVVHVYQCAEAEGRLFIAMELVNGTTLTRWQAEPGRSWQEILAMYGAAGQGLLAAHEAGLVHRDFKPDNVLIGKDGRPRVADFGLVRMDSEVAGAAAAAARRPPIAPSEPLQPEDAALTQAGVVMGTPLYMSPEQFQGEAVDTRSDQFSFCVALYEALYRQLPFAGSTLESLAFNAITGRIRSRPADSKVPGLIHQVLLRGLSSAPEKRWPSMRELLSALHFDPHADRTAGPRSRRKVTIGMLSFLIMSTLGMKLLRWLGVSTLAASIAMGCAFFLVFALLAILFRHDLKNPFHRGTLAYGLGYTAHVLALRIIGMWLGLSYTQVVTIDLMTLSVMSGLAAAWFMPGLGLLVPVSAVSALLAALYPAHALTLSTAVMVLATLLSLYLWNRSVGKIATRMNR